MGKDTEYDDDDPIYIPQARPPWNRHEYSSHLFDIFLALISGLMVGILFAWKLARLHGHAP